MRSAAPSPGRAPAGATQLVERTVRLLDGTVVRVQLVDDGGAVRVVLGELAFDEAGARPVAAVTRADQGDGVPVAAPAVDPVSAATTPVPSAAIAGRAVQQPAAGLRGIARRRPRPAGPPPIAGVFAMLAGDRPPQRAPTPPPALPPQPPAPSSPTEIYAARTTAAAQPPRRLPPPAFAASALVHPRSLERDAALVLSGPPSDRDTVPESAPAPELWDDGYDRPFMLGPVSVPRDLRNE